MLPPPTTKPTWIPAPWTSPSSAAVAFSVAVSMPEPPVVPDSASPLSLMTTRRYLRVAA